MRPLATRASEDSPEPLKGSCRPLSSLPPGLRAHLCRHSRTPVPQRLRDLGFVADTPLVVVRAAPLGDPVEVEIRGYRVCLRRADVSSLCVVPETPA